MDTDWKKYVSGFKDRIENVIRTVTSRVLPPDSTTKEKVVPEASKERGTKHILHTSTGSDTDLDWEPLIKKD